MTITATAAATGVVGVYFTGGTFTNCNIDLRDATISGMIASTSGATFSGGTIRIRSVTTSQIVFRGRMSSNVDVDIQHCTLTYDEALTAHSATGGQLPNDAFAITSSAASLSLRKLAIVGNTVTVASAGRTVRRAMVFEGRQGDAVDTYLLVYGNRVRCTSCTEAALRVALIPAATASDSGAWGVRTNFTVSGNDVTADLRTTASDFDVCLIVSSGFLSPVVEVADNKCTFTDAVGRGSAWSANGLRLTVPVEIMFSQFGYAFRRCTELGAMHVLRNTVTVTGTDSGASGITIDGYVGPTANIASNTVKAQSFYGAATGIKVYPVCIGMHSKFSSSWAMGCFLALGSCALPLSALDIRLNNVDVDGSLGEIIGVQFTAVALRSNPPIIFVGTIPIPSAYTFAVVGNVIKVLSDGANRTRALYIGHHSEASMPMTTTSTGNTLTVICKGAVPVGGTSCEGAALFQGLPTAYMVSMLASFKPLQEGSATLGDTITVTCQHEFEQCAGHNLALMPTMSAFALTVSGTSIVQIEAGDQAAAAGASARMQRTAPISIARMDVVASNPVCKLTLEVRTSSFELRRRMVADAGPQQYRGVLRLDRASRFELSNVPIVDSTFLLRHEFSGAALWPTPASAAALIVLPFDSTARLKLAAQRVTFGHEDVCRATSTDDWETCNRGPTAVPLRLDPPGPTTYTASKLELRPATFRKRMFRRCAVYFNPPLATQCLGCSLAMGCAACDDSKVGLPSAATGGWVREYDVCPPRTRTFTPPPKVPSKTRERTLSRSPSSDSTLTSSLPLTPSRPLTDSDTHSDPLTATRTIKPIPIPTRTPPLTDSLSKNTISRSRGTESRTASESPSEAKSASRTRSFTRPACPRDLHMDVRILGGDSSSRVVERGTVKLLLLFVTGAEPGGADATAAPATVVLSNGGNGQTTAALAPAPLGPTDGLLAKNISISDITVIDVPGAVPLEVTAAKVRSLRILEVTVRAPASARAFRDDVSARFVLNTDLLACRWVSRARKFQSSAVLFERRFLFAPVGAVDGVIGAGVAATYLGALLLGSSGVSHWYAVRRSIGFFDAVSCGERKDSLVSVFDSPLQLEIGADSPRSFARGAVVGNGLLCMGLCAIALGASLYRSQTTWKPPMNNEALAWAGAPAWMFPLTAILIPGTVQGIVELVGSKSVVDIGVAIVLGGACVILTPLAVMVAVLPREKLQRLVICVPTTSADADADVSAGEAGGEARRPAAPTNLRSLSRGGDSVRSHSEGSGRRRSESFRGGRRSLSAAGRRRQSRYDDDYHDDGYRHRRGGRRSNDDDDDDDDDDNNESSPAPPDPRIVALQQRIWKLRPRSSDPPASLLRRFFAPSARWRTLHPGSHFVNRYGTAFDTNAEALFFVTVLDVAVSVVGAVVAGLPASARESRGCKSGVVAHISILFLGVLLALLQPFTIRFDNAALLVMYALGLTNAIVAVVADYRGDPSLGPVVDGIVFAMLVLCIVKALVDAARLKFFASWQVRQFRLWIKRANHVPPRPSQPQGGVTTTTADALLSGRGGNGGFASGGDDFDDSELRSMDRIDWRRYRTLPVPADGEDFDLTCERRRRQRLAKGLIDNDPTWDDGSLSPPARGRGLLEFVRGTARNPCPVVNDVNPPQSTRSCLLESVSPPHHDPDARGISCLLGTTATPLTPRVHATVVMDSSRPTVQNMRYAIL